MKTVYTPNDFKHLLSDAAMIQAAVDAAAEAGVSNVISGKGHAYVFGGNSPIEIKTQNIVVADENTKLCESARVIEK